MREYGVSEDYLFAVEDLLDCANIPKGEVKMKGPHQGPKGFSFQSP